MDRELPEHLQKKVVDTALAIDGVLGIHGLRTREAGSTRFIQLHIELDNHLSLLKAHAISDEVESALMKVFPSADIIVHMDPEIIAYVEGSITERRST